MSTTRDPELEAFKTEIDLRAYAAEVEGYVLDARESWRGSSVMRHPNGDKLIIKRDADGHYVYFSVRDESDNGSIIDFVQRRRPGTRSLGRVRQALRPWLGGGRARTAASLPLFAPLTPTTKDRLAVEREFRLMSWVERHAWLEGTRCIPYAVLTADRFAGRICTDRRGNAVFPHFDQEGLCGYEIRNAGYTGFAKGGEKGLWLSRTHDGDDCLVLCESALDALSHAALFPSGTTRYASIGGQMNRKQPVLLAALLQRLPDSATVVAATDNDADGWQYAETFSQLVHAASRDDLVFHVQRPDALKDWNDVLQSHTVPSPTAHVH